MPLGVSNYDSVVCEENDRKLKAIKRQYETKAISEIFERFLHSYIEVVQDAVHHESSIQPGYVEGSHNAIYRLSSVKESENLILKVPWHGVTRFPVEKLLKEAATLVYLFNRTTIPIAPCFDYGAAGNNPADLGPYMISNYVKHWKSLSEILTTDESRLLSLPHRLGPDVSEEKLKYLYDQMAAVLLEMSTRQFSQIGSLLPKDIDNFEACSLIARPLSQNMYELVQLAGVPIYILPKQFKTFSSADEWYVALADMHVAHLLFQRNGLVTSPDDCRNKYVARLLFRRLAKEGKLSTFGFADDTWSAQASQQVNGSGQNLFRAPNNKGPFRLWADNLRGDNVLINKNLTIAAIIDWKFTYAGPTQFVLDPPWWLLLREPEAWPGGLDEWEAEYEVRFETWLQSMERAQQEMDANEALWQRGRTILEESGDERLGTFGCDAEPLENLPLQMRQSWSQGRFWLNYAARKSWAFDLIYWKHLDQRFFGERSRTFNGQEEELWKARVDMMTDEERRLMEILVLKKMEEKEARNMVSWQFAEAREYLAQYLH